MKNNVINQGVTETPSYIIVTINSESKLILPYFEGIEFLRIWSGSTEIYQKWSSDPPVLRDVDKVFELKFISEKIFKEMKMAAVIGTDLEKADG